MARGFRWLVSLCLLACVVALGQTHSDLERGRYLVVIGHCNNCQTAGCVEAGGAVPESAWLMGNAIGWRSAAGTAYPGNLRIYSSNLSEHAWLHVARTIRTRRPMPWWSLRDTSDEDQRAMHRYIRSLLPLGELVPAFLPPDRIPHAPYVQLPMPAR